MLKKIGLYALGGLVVLIVGLIIVGKVIDATKSEETKLAERIGADTVVRYGKESVDLVEKSIDKGFENYGILHSELNDMKNEIEALSNEEKKYILEDFDDDYINSKKFTAEQLYVYYNDIFTKTTNILCQKAKKNLDFIISDPHNIETKDYRFIVDEKSLNGSDFTFRNVFGSFISANTNIPNCQNLYKAATLGYKIYNNKIKVSSYSINEDLQNLALLVKDGYIKVEDVDLMQFLRMKNAELKEHKTEQQRLAKEKAEAERLAKEKAEAERLAKEKAERLAKEKAEKEKAERIAKERAERTVVVSRDELGRVIDKPHLYKGKIIKFKDKVDWDGVVAYTTPNVSSSNIRMVQLGYVKMKGANWKKKSYPKVYMPIDIYNNMDKAFYNKAQKNMSDYELETNEFELSVVNGSFLRKNYGSDVLNYGEYITDDGSYLIIGKIKSYTRNLGEFKTVHYIY